MFPAGGYKVWMLSGQWFYCGASPWTCVLLAGLVLGAAGAVSQGPAHHEAALGLKFSSSDQQTYLGHCWLGTCDQSRHKNPSKRQMSIFC